MSFWDASDDFTFEKSFMISNELDNFQTKIWFIEFLELWITTDKSNTLHSWDLENEKVLKTLENKHHYSKDREGKKEAIKNGVISVV